MEYYLPVQLKSSQFVFLFYIFFRLSRRCFQTFRAAGIRLTAMGALATEQSLVPTSAWLSERPRRIAL